MRGWAVSVKMLRDLIFAIDKNSKRVYDELVAKCARSIELALYDAYRSLSNI